VLADWYQESERNPVLWFFLFISPLFLTAHMRGCQSTQMVLDKLCASTRAGSLWLFLCAPRASSPCYSTILCIGRSDGVCWFQKTGKRGCHGGERSSDSLHTGERVRAVNCAPEPEWPFFALSAQDRLPVVARTPGADIHFSPQGRLRQVETENAWKVSR